GTALRSRCSVWSTAWNGARFARGFCLGEPMDHSRSEVHVSRITFFGFPSEWQRCKKRCHIRPGLPIRRRIYATPCRTASSLPRRPRKSAESGRLPSMGGTAYHKAEEDGP